MSQLAAVLDVLLPGGEGFPSASTVDLEDRFHSLDDKAAAAWLLARLGGEFALLSAQEKVAALQAVERHAAEDFRIFLVFAYRAYYAAPAVQAVIEAKAGYRAGPPQPEGYSLEPFDPDWLALAATRPPLYRQAP